MPLIDTDQLQIITDALGAADTDLQATLDVETSTTAAAKVKLVRETIRSETTDDDIDAAVTWQTAVRTLERSLATQVDALLLNACRAMEVYYTAETGEKMRSYFSTFTTWSTAFRDLWRKAMNEELVVRLGTIAKSGGSWGSFTADKTISLDTELEVRTTSLIGAAAIEITLSLTRVTGANVTTTVSIPAATASGTAFDITGSALRYTGVASIVVTGGTNGDGLAVWTR